MATLDAFRLSIPFARAFTTSAGTFEQRELIVVAYDQAGHTGWGEHGPWPGQTPTDVPQAWAAVADATQPSGVALDLALLDHAARTRQRPLWDHLGGAGRVPMATAAVGLYPDMDLLLGRVHQLTADGVQAVKLKIAPGQALEPLVSVRSVFPDLVIGLDANAAFHEITPELVETARHEPAYIEQPFAPDRPDLARQLREQTGAVVIADETVVDLSSAVRAVEVRAADVLTVKLGRLGPTTAMEVLRWTAATGVQAKISGLFETSIGRAHSLAFAALEQVRHLDFSPATSHLRDDIVSDPWQVEQGQVALRAVPGIGVEPDRVYIEQIAVEHVRRSLPDAHPNVF